MKTKKNKGLYQQIVESPVEKLKYNNLSLEYLTEFVKEIGIGVEGDRIVYPKLTLEELKDYIAILHKVKYGFLYQITNSNVGIKDGRKFVVTTGYKGCKTFIKNCIKDNIPPELVIPDIVVIDYDNNISARLMDISMIKIVK